jgi:hypothetical protein
LLPVELRAVLYSGEVRVVATCVMIIGKAGLNQVKSAASFCYQVAAWVPAMFCNFYFVKNNKVVNNSKTTKAREKINTDLKSFEF